jgi:23S rRNA pseudouridine1911/1915/1917 synthase
VFQDHSIEREYRALVRGLPGAERGRIDRPIGRNRRDRKRMSVQVEVGREARTEWWVLRRFPARERSWLGIRPQTGRTHQIRVHLASIGLPIVGDRIYGRTRSPAPEAPGRPALHAAVLGFAHPRTGERMCFEAPLPADLAALLAELEGREAAQ